MEGWPHKVKGVGNHPKYPQLGYIEDTNCDVYPNDIILVDGRTRTALSPTKFKMIYKPYKNLLVLK
jgi:hypothetical protein